MVLCGPAELVGLEPADLEDGLREPSVLKKLERRLRRAGEEGIFCKVSIVRSESDGRGLRKALSEDCSFPNLAAAVSSSSVVSFPSRRYGCGAFLKSFLLGFF
jgi:hypothetical protein